MSLADRAWYPVAISSGIEPGTSNGTRLDGREIVVWRDAEGTAHVWEDRCPHRGMRLSFGFVRGSEIACLYHGWRYDGAGRCRYIPAHPQLTPPETIRVPSFETTERLGMVWARAGDGAAVDLPEERTVTEVRSITVACGAERVAAETARDAGRTVASLTPSLLLFWTGEDQILAGVQPLSEAECVLHVVLSGDRGRAGRKRVSAWAEELRGALEAGGSCP